MKKFFILTIALCSLCSCAITTHSLYGNVTTFTPQGDTLKVYKNVLIRSVYNEYASYYNGYAIYSSNAIKDYGLNFTDSTGRGIIIGNAVPYIVEYKVEVKVDTISTSTPYCEEDEEYKNYR